IKSTTFREAKKAPALPGLQVCSQISLRDHSPRRSDFYPKTQITLTAVQKMQVVVQKTIFAQAARAGGLRSQKTLTDNLVQKLLVESGCRVSQRRNDFLLIALQSGQPWRLTYNCRERRPRTPPTSTSAAGCACAALCLQ